MRFVPNTILCSAEECLWKVAVFVAVLHMAELKAREGNLPKTSPLASLRTGT